jgi:hypothetical protein
MDKGYMGSIAIVVQWHARHYFFFFKNVEIFTHKIVFQRTKSG